MKYLLSLLLFISIASFSQTEQGEKTHNVIAVSPEYPGGPSKMVKFIQESFEYPEEARQNREQGTIRVEFMVMKSGELDSIKVVKGVSKSLDAEAIRVISLMPKWSPGEQAGKPVDVRYTIPITAKLASKEKKKKWFRRN